MRSGPRAVILGCPQPMNRNRWKDGLAEEAEALGWDVTHIPAKGIRCEDVVRVCRGADLLIWARTHHHQPAGDIHGMLRAIEDTGTGTVALHLDKYFGVPHREARIGEHPWWTCQTVWTADGGHERDFAARGIPHYWCPPALEARWLGRGRRDPGRWPTGPVFVGGLVPATHGRHRVDLLEWAARRYPSFRRFGGCGYPLVWGEDLRDLLATCRVVIGDSAPGDYYWSDRIMTLGRGGLLAHPYRRGMAEHGFTGDVMIVFDEGDFDGLAEQVAAVTARSRRDMTDAAIDLVASRHLWRHRLAEIERVMLT